MEEAINKEKETDDITSDVASNTDEAPDITSPVQKELFTPDDSTSEEDLNKFYAKLGRPESFEKYNFNKGDIPEGMEYSDEQENNYRQKAFELGLTQKQAHTLFGWHNELQKKIFEENVQTLHDEQETALKALKKEHGVQYEKKLKLAKSVVTDFGVGKVLNKAGLGNNPELISMFIKIGEKISETPLHGAESKTSQDNAALNLDKLTKDLNGPYLDGSHPLHKETVAKVQKIIDDR